MKLEILGSGGATTTPKPFCTCETCLTARSGGPRDSRLGPSVFIHGPDLLIDTPEEIFVQLNRSGITQIAACLYSHWHPDHTSGRRVFEMNKDWAGFPPKNKTIKVFITEKVEQTFVQFMGLKSHFDFLVAEGLVDLVVVGNAERFQVNDYTVEPIQLGQDYSFGFDISGGGRRALVIMDELKLWIPSQKVCDTEFDLIYLPIGIIDVNPITGNRNIDPRHSILETEQTLAETLDYVNMLNGKKFVLGHIEEPDGVGFDMGQLIGRFCSETTGKSVTVAYDSYECEI
jgi:phosphoribosyl 1,2-cyclic phosphate phosphodiesterase